LTTIIYRDGVMVSDSIITEGKGFLHGEVQKIVRFKDGTLLGAAGPVAECQHMLSLFPDLDQVLMISAESDACGLLAHPDGKLELIEGGVFVAITDSYFAIGTGAPFAMGAMDAGADALKALHVAMKRDAFTAGRVQKLRHRDE
jgi:ATP-dependent protease HslVU (ClpYQ) peptidase subunit